MATRRRRFDVALLALPAIAMGAGFLPERTTKRALGFAYTDPTPLTAYTSHVIHLDLGHLLGNLSTYVLLAGTFYGLCLLAAHQDFWRTVMIAYLLAFPPTLAALNLAIEREAISIGFSGMNTALLGALPVGIALVLTQYNTLTLRDAPVLVVPTLWSIIVVGLPRRPATGVAVALLIVLTLIYAHSVFRADRRSMRERIAPVLADPTASNRIAIATVLLLVYPLIIFSTGNDPSGPVPNHYIHLLGYCLGFLVAFIAAFLLVEE